MFKLKKITSKYSVIPGMYLQFTKQTGNLSGTEIFKVTNVDLEIKKVSFAWYRPKNDDIEVFKNWCSLKSLEEWIANKGYVPISEDSPMINKKLRDYVQT